MNLGLRLVEIEEEHLSGFFRSQVDHALIGDGDGIAASECPAIKRDFAFSHLDPGMATVPKARPARRV